MTAGAVRRAAAGKGVNVARALTALGVPATLLAYLGGANGRRMQTDLRRDGIAARVVETAADTRTCVSLLEGPPAGPARQVTELVEPAAAASGAEQERFAAAYEESGDTPVTTTVAALSDQTSAAATWTGAAGAGAAPGIWWRSITSCRMRSEAAPSPTISGCCAPPITATAMRGSGPPAGD